MMMFLSVPPPAQGPLPVRGPDAIMHGDSQAANMMRGILQKLLDISKILQGFGILPKMKVNVGTDKGVFAYQYVGEEVELLTLVVEGKETRGSVKDLEDLGGI
jgi:hypothetical protein